MRSADPVFRWDLRKRSQLGRLAESGGERTASAAASTALEGFAQLRDEELVELRLLAARTLAASGGGDLWFIGRSLEPVFDYLSGLFMGREQTPRLSLSNISVSRGSYERRELRSELERLGLHPRELYRRARPQVLCDVIYSGGTMGTLISELDAWAAEAVGDAKAVMRQLRIVGVLIKRKPSPNASRWQQEVAWLRRYPTLKVENVAIPYPQWSAIADRDPKVGVWNPASRWGTSLRRDDRLHPRRLLALRRALAVFDAASTREERAAFRTAFAATKGVEHRWGRGVLAALK
ncbi:MAG: hypothetical protein KDA24_13895 [Deltaproteobacteria bacterium]|nr:hypothetical protein [Deltaproteobacteria bacterium]